MLDVRGNTHLGGSLDVDGHATLADGLTVTQTNNDEFALRIEGAAFTTTGLFRSSDARLKTNVWALKDPLYTLLLLQGVSFEWIDPAGRYGRHFGMIAQDVEQVFPNWVTTGPDGYKSVSYEGFEALAVESLRQLKNENDELRAQNEELRLRLERVEKAVERLTPNAPPE
jgi:hypothetical protein